MSSRRRKAIKKELSSPGKLTLKEKAWIAGLIIVVFGGCALMAHFSGTSRQSRSVAYTVEQWRNIYHFDAAAAARLREIELDFHGNGGLFSFDTTKTPAQMRQHSEEMAQLIPAELRERFLKMENRNRGH